MDTTPSSMACLVVCGPSVIGFSFDEVDADDYERLRPDYSAAAVAWLVTAATLARDGRVADVAAGTGARVSP